MNDHERLGLSEQDLLLVRGILSRQIPGRPVYVFGSRATGKARRLSDIDLAIGGSDALTLLQRALLNEEFSESDLPMTVDVLDLNAITPEFHQRISRDFISIQERATEHEVAA